MHNKPEEIVYLKPHMVLYGVVKMICMNENGSKSKYEVFGIDKLSAENLKLKQLHLIRYISQKFLLSIPK